jgi:hypothetical protein
MYLKEVCDRMYLFIKVIAALIISHVDAYKGADDPHDDIAAIVILHCN